MQDEWRGHDLGRDGIEWQFRSLLEKLPTAAYTCDREGLITFFNQHAAQLWGRAPKLNDAVDRFCGSFRLFSTDGLPIPHAQCWMALALQTGKEYNGEEITIERADGSRFVVLAHANPIRDDSGNLLGAVNVLVDITDRKRAREALAALAAIVESSDDAIISKTLDGRILSWNAGAERLFGYVAHEAIGSPITLIIPPERHNEERLILASLRRGDRIDHFETVRVAKGGRRIDISLTISPVRDSTGCIVATSKVARDITPRKQAEKALVVLKDELADQLADLRRLHEMSMRLSTTRELPFILEETLRTATVIDGTDLGLLWLCNSDQSFLEVAASLGFKEDYLKTVDRLSQGGDACATCFRERQRVVIEDVETDAVFAPYREAALQAGFKSVHSTPLITHAGKVLGVLSTYSRRRYRPSDRETHLMDLCVRQAVDFIENAQLHDQLREADRRKDEFLAMLAHELRTPLAPISNSLNILRLSDDRSPAVERMHEIIEQQVSHMVRLVDDLLEISRITRGKIELRKERVDLFFVIRSAIETSRPLIEAAGHQLAITLSPEPITLEADPVRLTQVIANLLNNAAKYTGEGGQIWLSAQRGNGEAVVSVRDSGVGISSNMLSHVFDLFAQADCTIKRAQGGLGIGLTLARSLVQMHGGCIEAHSDGPGKGSTFVIRLPLAPNAPRSVVSVPALQSSSATLPVRRILVVDDTPAAAYTLGKLLEKIGQEVWTAHDAASALEIVRTMRPDVVVSDIAMPNMDGYELARRLRQAPGLKGVVLVALTGYGHDSDRQAAKEAGFDYHLVKPVDLKGFQDLLASLPKPLDAVLSNMGSEGG